jgi:hypothetical protein
VAPVLPDELLKGHWRRRLVLPNGRGELRLTPVKPARGRETATADAADTQDLDEHRRHSA